MGVIARIALVLLTALPCFGQRLDAFYVATILKPTAAPSSPTPELVWWKLNEGSGTAIDGTSSGGGDDGTTDADWTTGASGSGSSLNYNGTSDDASTSASITYGVNKFTLCFWLNPTTASSRMIAESSANLNSNDNSFYIFKAGAATIQCAGKNGGSRTETFTITTGSWHHYAILWDGSISAGDWKLYKDGTEVTADSIDVNSRSSTANMDPYTLYVGARGSSSLFYEGALDDFRVYNRLLSESEITAVFGNPQ